MQAGIPNLLRDLILAPSGAKQEILNIVKSRHTAQLHS